MEVKNKFNYPIGRIDESGSSRNATHYQAGVVGFYNESSDLTYDCRNGTTIYCRGNGLHSLLLEVDRELNGN